MNFLFICESLIYIVCLSIILTKILNYEFQKRTYRSILSIYCIILTVMCFSNNTLMYSTHALFPFFNLIILCLIFRNIKLSIIIRTYTCIYCVNTIIALFISILFNIEYENTIFIDLVVNVTICSLLIIIYQTKFGAKIQQLIDWIPKSGKRLALVALIISMILLSLVFDNNYFGDENVWFEFVQKSMILGTILLLVIVGVSVCIMLSNTQLKQLTANYEQQILAQAEHYKRLAESNYELRRFKHDFKNMSIAIEKMLDSEELKDALQLFQQYNHTLEHSNGFTVMYDTGNGIADALLSDKQQKALSYNCNIVFQGAIPSNHLMPTDICVILGNTLDNAIEACEKCKTTEPLTITVTCNCNSGFMFLSITNPIYEKVNISNNHIATTKENKTLHGFGLYSLHSVVQKYDGKIELKSTDTTFTANIDLCLAN